MEKVTLDSWELDIGKWLARKRRQESKAYLKGYDNTTRMGQYALESMALLGELAFAKLCNLYFPLCQDPRGKNLEVDFTLPDGRTVDVKTTEYRTGKLLLKVKEYEREKCDLYVLMIDAEPDFYYAGYATKDMLIRDENILTFGKHKPPAYGMLQCNLVQGLPLQRVTWFET